MALTMEDGHQSSFPLPKLLRNVACKMCHQRHRCGEKLAHSKQYQIGEISLPLPQVLLVKQCGSRFVITMPGEIARAVIVTDILYFLR